MTFDIGWHYNIMLACKIVILIKINITCWITKPRPNTWWNLDTGDIAWRRVIFQKISNRLRRLDARMVHHKFWLASYERLNIQSMKYNSNIQTWIVFKPNLVMLITRHGFRVTCGGVILVCHPRSHIKYVNYRQISMSSWHIFMLNFQISMVNCHSSIC